MLDTRGGMARLADGRRLAWTETGPPDGRPVVYLHGAMGTPMCHDAQLDGLIARLGLRYIEVSRPGFGRSDPRPGRCVADFAGDVGRLADHLALDRFAVLGVSAGGPYALACSALLGDRVTRTAAVSCLSATCPPHRAGMPRAMATSLRVLARCPGAGERCAAPVIRHLQRHPDRLARLVVTGTPRADRLPGQDAPAAAAFLHAVQGGVSGLIDDYVVACAPWGFDPAEVRGRVDIHHGADDPLVPARHARALARTLPNATAAVYPGEGHFFLRRRLADVLAPLADADGPGLHPGCARLALQV